MIGLMSWDATAWDGKCQQDTTGDGEENPPPCSQVEPCGALVALNFMYVLPSGVTPDVSMSQGSNEFEVVSMKKLTTRGGKDSWAIVINIYMGADCNNSTHIIVDNNWQVSLNGNTASWFSASGTTDFELVCEPC